MNLIKYFMCGIFCLALQWSHTQQTSTLKSSGPVSLENTFSEKVVNMHNTGILYSLLSDDFISHHFPKPGNNFRISRLPEKSNLNQEIRYLLMLFGKELTKRSLTGFQPQVKKCK
jgi:hypothetical protein